MLTLSTGKNAAVAPYSGHMLAMVARSAMDSWATPGPKNSTNFPTTPTWRRCWAHKKGGRKRERCYGTSHSSFVKAWTKPTASTLVTVRTMSVEVMSLSGVPCSLYPTTSGSTMLIGWPSITASASIPPTPGGLTVICFRSSVYSSVVQFLFMFIISYHTVVSFNEIGNKSTCLNLHEIETNFCKNYSQALQPYPSRGRPGHRSWWCGSLCPQDCQGRSTHHS